MRTIDGRPVDTRPVLSARDLSKSFGPTRVLDGVSLDVCPGRIHAMIGGNGSGKSTTIKILAGVVPADAGTINLPGVSFDACAMSPHRARSVGLRFVHQQQSTFPDLTVAENLAIGAGFPTSRIGAIRWRAARRHACQVLDRFGIDADPNAELTRLNPATRTMVSIARALQDQEGAHEGVLVLDEPTAALPAGDVQTLLDALRRYANAGQAIVLVTHRLGEVAAVADDVSVLRDGRVAARLTRGEFDHDKLVGLMMGRQIDDVTSLQRAEIDDPVVLRASELTGGGLRGVSLCVHAGEIAGIAGLVGSGRSTLLRMLFGISPIRAGTVTIDGVTRSRLTPRVAMRAGMAFVPEDRVAEGMFAELSVTENLGMCTTREFFRGGRMCHRAERAVAQQLSATYGIKTSAVSAPMMTLSGGNQQKVVLARWMRRDPRLLLLDEPTQGVDVGTRADIWNIVRRRVDQGAAALVVSSDPEELARVADRVHIIDGGRISHTLSGEQVSDHHITRLMLSVGAGR